MRVHLDSNEVGREENETRSLPMVKVWKDEMRMEICFSGRIPDDISMDLDPIDREVIKDIGKPGLTAADWLLGLELLCRRTHEHYVRTREKDES